MPISTDNFKTTNNGWVSIFPDFIFVSVVCLSDAVSLNNLSQWEAGDGLWWWVALTGGSCLRVTGPRPGGAGSGSEYYGVWGEEWVGTPALLRPPVSLSHYAQSHSEAETDDEMTSDLGNLESPPDQWCWAFKVKIVELKWDESVKRNFCEQWWNVKVCKHFKILK